MVHGKVFSYVGKYNRAWEKIMERGKIRKCICSLVYWFQDAV